MGRVQKDADAKRHDAVRQRAAKVLRDVSVLEAEGPRVSLETLQEFPTTEYWLRPENRIDLSEGHENPLISGELSTEDLAVSLAAADVAPKAGKEVLEQIDLVNLVEAKKAFMVHGGRRRAPRDADEESESGYLGARGDGLAEQALSLDAFTRAFAKVCNVPRHELLYLFMKIDHNSDGLVSWDEFLSFVVLSDKGQQASRMMEGAQHKFEPQPRAPGDRQANGHRERINRIIYVPVKNHYVTASRDGTLRVWDATTLAHVHTVVNGHSWINDTVLLNDLATNKLAVASADRTISFYEMSSVDSKRLYSLHGRMALLDLPLCLAYWLQNSQTPVLGCGDDTGCVSVYDARELLKVVARAGEGRKPVEPFVSKRTRLYTLKLHHDWVTSLSHVPGLHALLSAGLDASIKLTDLTRQLDTNGDGIFDEDEITTLHTLSGHTKGVFALVTLLVGGRQLAVSSSLDRRVVVWNLETGDEVTSLDGHRSYVQAMAVNEPSEQLITLGADSEVRVWELITFTCTQVIPVLGSEVLAGCGAILFNAHHQCLVSGARQLTLWQPRRFFVPLDVIRATSLAPKGHKVAVVAVLYCTLYHLVLSADESSVVSVWDVHSGRALFRFEHAEAKLTAMALDNTGRRLVTGADDGAVRLYNFSSGELLRSFVVHTGGSLGETRREELTAVLHIAESGQQYMCAAGWSRQVWVWADTPEGELGAGAADGAPRVLGGHSDDIVCMSYIRPGWLVRARARARAPPPSPRARAPRPSLTATPPTCARARTPAPRAVAASAPLAAAAPPAACTHSPRRPLARTTARCCCGTCSTPC